MERGELIKKLGERGITFEKMLDTALELYVGEEREKVRGELRGLMLHYLGFLSSLGEVYVEDSN